MKNYSFGRSFCWEYAKKAFLSFENRLIVHFVSHEDVFPFNNLYETPKTLGIDGWFCNQNFTISKCNRLVIDAEHA
jgi:type III pantothenate kinase